MSSRKNPQPSDEDVANIISQLGAPPESEPAPEPTVAVAGDIAIPLQDEAVADDSEFLSMAELSPASPTEKSITMEEDERPIVINLPERADPTQVVLAAEGPEVVKLVEPVVLGAVVANKPAFDNEGNPLTTASSPVAHTAEPSAQVSPFVEQQRAQALAVAQVIHSTTPIVEDPEHHPTKEESDVCATFGVNVWWEPVGEYWSIRQGPRRGGIPKGAPIDEWKSRCASISVTQKVQENPGS